MNSERLGRFRFRTRAGFEAVVGWYQQNLTSPPWEIGNAIVIPSAYAVAAMARPNADGLTTTIIKIITFAAEPGATYIFYEIPMESEHYSEDLEKLRHLSEESHQLE